MEASVASKPTQTQFPKCLERCNITNMAKLTTSTSGGMSPTASLASAPPPQTAITPLPPTSSKDPNAKDDTLKEVLVVSPREAIVISSTCTTNQKDNDDCDPETATETTTTTTTTILVAKTIHNDVSNSAVTSNDISECTCGVEKVCSMKRQFDTNERALKNGQFCIRAKTYVCMYHLLRLYY